MLEFARVEYKTYIFNGEEFDVRQDFWDAFDACPQAECISHRAYGFGVGVDDFTMNQSNLSVIICEDDVMLISRPNMAFN